MKCLSFIASIGLLLSPIPALAQDKPDDPTEEILSTIILPEVVLDSSAFSPPWTWDGDVSAPAMGGLFSGGEPGAGPVDYVPGTNDGTGGGSATPSTKDVKNNVTNSCMRQQVESTTSSSLTSTLSQMVQQTFRTDELTTVEIEQSNSLPIEVDGTTTFQKSGAYFTATILLNETTLAGASLEYVAATVYHELLHAVLSASGIAGPQQHEEMASSYVGVLASALRESFPALSDQDAIDLSWGGLQSTAAWNNLSPAQRAGIVKTNGAYKSRQLGGGCR